MNLNGDLRYVTPANYAEFADAGSEKRREDAWRQVQDLRKRRARRLGQPGQPTDSEARKAWMQAHPPGFLEQREAFGPRGTYGRWLRARPAIFVSQETAFMHGGLSPAFAGDLARADRPARARGSRGPGRRPGPLRGRGADPAVLRPAGDLPRGPRRAGGAHRGRSRVALGRRAGRKDVLALRGRRATAQGLRALSRLGALDGQFFRRPPLVSRLQPVERRRGRGRDAAAPGGGRRRAFRRRAHDS